MGKLSDQTEKTTLNQTDIVYLVQSPYAPGDDRKATIADLGDAVGRFQDRGDLADYDWTTGDFTKDGSWHDLDCSSIVPADAKVIVFRLLLNTSAVADYSFSMRKKGKTGLADFQVFTHVAGRNQAAIARIPCSTDRIVQYLASNTTWTTLSVAVIGWEL